MGRSEKIETGWPGYVSTGSGSVWSEWLLSPFRQVLTDSIIGLRFAVYAIEAVKQVDPNVGGEIQAGRISLKQTGWRATTLSSNWVGKIADEVRKRKELSDQFWILSTHDPTFEEDVKKRVEKYIKRVVEEE